MIKNGVKQKTVKIFCFKSLIHIFLPWRLKIRTRHKPASRQGKAIPTGFFSMEKHMLIISIKKSVILGDSMALCAHKNDKRADAAAIISLPGRMEITTILGILMTIKAAVIAMGGHAYLLARA